MTLHALQYWELTDFHRAEAFSLVTIFLILAFDDVGQAVKSSIA